MDMFPSYGHIIKLKLNHRFFDAFRPGHVPLKRMIICWDGQGRTMLYPRILIISLTPILLDSSMMSTTSAGFSGHIDSVERKKTHWSSVEIKGLYHRHRKKRHF